MTSMHTYIYISLASPAQVSVTKLISADFIKYASGFSLSEQCRYLHGIIKTGKVVKCPFPDLKKISNSETLLKILVWTWIRDTAKTRRYQRYF